MKKQPNLPLVPCLIGLLLTGHAVFAEPAAGAPTPLGSFRSTPVYQGLGQDGPELLKAHRFAFSQRGLVAVSPDGGSLVAYRPDGEADWSRPSPTGATTGVAASADGRCWRATSP